MFSANATENHTTENHGHKIRQTGHINRDFHILAIDYDKLPRVTGHINRDIHFLYTNHVFYANVTYTRTHAFYMLWSFFALGAYASIIYARDRKSRTQNLENNHKNRPH